MTCDELQQLLEKYAKASGCTLTERYTPDGWDIVASIVDSKHCPRLTGIGFPRQDAYKQLLHIVLAHHHWTSIDELCIWTDMHDIN